MRKFLLLLLCLSLSVFTVARATKLTVTTREQAGAKTFFKHPNTEEETGSDNDENPDGTSNDNENTADDNADNAAADQGAANDNGANDNDADNDADDDGDGGE